MTTLAIVVALVLLLRAGGFAEPLAALVAAFAALFLAGLPFDKIATLIAGTAPRSFDYVTLALPVAAIVVSLLSGMQPEEARPRRPLG